MNITIRAATVGDSDTIHRLNSHGFGYEFPTDATRERVRSIIVTAHNRIFVAIADGCAIGYAHAADYDCTYSPPLKNLLAIVVDERYRGLRVGLALLVAVEDWARQDGALGVRLVSGFNRAAAHKFYLDCGYTHRKDQKNFIKLF